MIEITIGIIAATVFGGLYSMKSLRRFKVKRNFATANGYLAACKRREAAKPGSQEYVIAHKECLAELGKIFSRT
jgi:hypothetical protein